MYRVGDKIVCINDDEVVFLTLGKVYTILNIKAPDYNQKYYLIINNYETENLYSDKRFISLKEYRKRKLNRIYENR